MIRCTTWPSRRTFQVGGQERESFLRKCGNGTLQIYVPSPGPYGSQTFLLEALQSFACAANRDNESRTSNWHFCGFKPEATFNSRTRGSGWMDSFSLQINRKYCNILKSVGWPLEGYPSRVVKAQYFCIFDPEGFYLRWTIWSQAGLP